MIATDSMSLIVGAGATGLSVARYFEKNSIRYKVFDTRLNDSLCEGFKKINENVQFYCGEVTEAFLEGVSQLILSPGVSRSENIVQWALGAAIPVRSDISLFLESVSQPVIGITGSNGKSTVTTMVGLAAEQAGLKVGVGGNLGVPALDLIDLKNDLYVLELSSFQLESTDSANLDVAVNLNVSPDHLDRHGSLQAYFQAKQKIFHGAKSVVYKLSDPLTQPPVVEGVHRYGFGLSAGLEKTEKQFVYDAERGSLNCDNEKWMSKSEICQLGLHNVENVLAVAAIASAANISRAAVTRVAQTFSGLAHRCEHVATVGNVTYINDSKATNAGSTIAALNGFVSEARNILLIVGGRGKGLDFSELADVIVKCVSNVFLIGEEAENIDLRLAGRVPSHYCSTLNEAVQLASEAADSGDLVLFSPACASFDMFKSFEHRGNCFKQAVAEVAA